MATYAIGHVLRRLREYKKLTQEDLSDGICSTVTLSKIENGVQSPRKEHFEALMQRLGYSADNFFCTFYADDEYAAFEKTEELKLAIANFDFPKARGLIAQLEGDRFFAKEFNLQLLLSSKAAVLLHERQDLDQALALLLQALQITIPKFQLDRIGDLFLTHEEIVAINMIAILYYDQGMLEQAIDILLQLKDRLDKTYVDEKEKARTYPMIVYNLTKYLIEAKRFNDALPLCETTRRFCSRNGAVDLLPFIVFNQACCLCEMGNPDPCTELFRQAYYALRLVENYTHANEVRNEVLEKYGINIVSQT